MAVEVDDADGAVGAVDAPEEGERDGVVAAEGDDAGEGFAVFGGAGLVGVGGGFAGQEGVVAFFDLFDGVRVVISITTPPPNQISTAIPLALSPPPPLPFPSEQASKQRVRPTTSPEYPRNPAPAPSC